MRLIDADELLKGYHDHERISTHIIWNAPTVEAIPIEWLKEQAEDTTYEHRVDGLIERWRREHGEAY